MIEKFLWLGLVKNECGYSDLWALKLTVTQERNDGICWLYAGTNSCKLKADQRFIGCAWSKIGVISLVMGLYNWLYLKNKNMEYTGFFCLFFLFLFLFCFFACCYKFKKAKSWFGNFWVAWSKIEVVFSVHETLKSTVS